MKKIFAKQNILPVVILGTICLVVAALLGVVNMITSPIIEDANNKKANAALLVVLPDGKDFAEIELADDYPEEVSRAYKADIGYVFELKTRGKEQLTVMCGVDNDGKIVKIQVLSEQETPGYKEKVFPYVTGDEGKYNGKDSSNLEPELFAGATLTSNGIYDAVKAALDGFVVAGGGEVVEEEEVEEKLPKTDEEIEAVIYDMIGGEVLLSELEKAEYPDVLKKIYSTDSNEYFLYIVVSGEYVPVATEAVVYLNSKFEIVNVNLLSWIVGHGVEAGDFAERFIGVGKDSVADVELVAEATGTSSDFRNAVKASLNYVVENIAEKQELPTSEEEIKSIAAEMIGEEIIISDLEVQNCPETLKKAYTVENKGYLLYIVVSGEYVPVATEAVVYLNSKFEIVNVNLLSWIVGHGVEAGDFAERFIGVGKDSVADVELVTDATGTSSDFRNALSQAVITIADGETAAETLFLKKMQNLVPNAEGFEALQIPADAPDTVKALYKVLGCDGYVVYVITSTQYVAKETESLVYVSNGKVKNIDLITWIVGHGVGPGDFASALVGKNAAQLSDVELVAEATGTASHLRDAVIDAVKVVPIDNTPAIVGVLVLALSVIAMAACIIVPKTMRRRKNG